MTTEIFRSWFKKFCQQVEERPLVIVYDGHLSQVSVNVIEKAISGNITIIKLPPHSSNKFEPLGPLKSLWSRELNDRVNEFGPKETLAKSAFVDVLCGIWHKGLTKDNLVSSFRTSGIYRVDPSKYPISHFDPRLLKKYEGWREKENLWAYWKNFKTQIKKLRI